MDPQDVIIALALEAAVERMREETRQMKELLRDRQVELQEKAKECEILKRKNQSMLAEQAAKQMLADHCMLFFEAIDINGDAEIAHNFDEKEMMDAILNMMNGEGGHRGNNGGFSADDGKKEG